MKSLVMFESLGRLMFRRRRLVLAAAGVFVVAAALWGTGVFGSLGGAGFEDPGSDSARAAQQAKQAFGRQAADVVVLYSSPSLTVDDTAFRTSTQRTLAALPERYVARTTSYWNTKAPQLVSTDRHATYVVLELTGADGDARQDALAAIQDQVAAPGLTTRVGGEVAIDRDIDTQVARDIARAERLSLPLLLVLLVVVFGALAAAGMPLLVGGLAILGAFTALRLLTMVTDVSVFAINLVTMLGLGLAIDYALFMVSRFREELATQPTGRQDVEAALVRTVATAGRTVCFSGLIVTISLAGLLLFPQMFLRSMAYGGIAAVLIAMVAALTVLPALLGVLGPRVNALSVPWRRRRPDRAGHSAGGAWSRIANSVMRRPLAYLVVIVVALVALGLPFRNVVFGGIDARALPADTESRQVGETLDRDFTRNATTTMTVVVDGADASNLRSYVERLRTVPGVTAAQVTQTKGATSRIAVRYDADPISPQARQLVTDVRTVPAPAGSSVLVGGDTAELVDLVQSLRRTLPWMALFVALVSFVLLFLAFGSVLLPLKAIVMNALSLTASFGALVWIFQQGHLSGLLGFTPTGTIEATQPILMLAIAFGLSMDYEVFLLSRVREQWDHTGDNTTAVATGLQRTGRIITSAALLLVIVIGAFSTSGVTFIKMIGVGMIIAILLDATVVRALLVPATMRLLGRYNWWAPKPLARFWQRYGHREDGQPAALAEPPFVPELPVEADHPTPADRR
jgi:RND superfamily putative drug exporter